MEVHTVMPQDAVKIIVNRDGLISTQIPVSLLLSVDDVLRWCFNGGRSLSVGLVRSEDPRAAMCWRAESNGLGGTGPTPWCAIQSLARAIKQWEESK